MQREPRPPQMAFPIRHTTPSPIKDLAMTPTLQKMIAASVLPSAITAEVTAYAFSLAAENTRSFLVRHGGPDTPRLAAPGTTMGRSTPDAVGALAVPPAGSLPA